MDSFMVTCLARIEITYIKNTCFQLVSHACTKVKLSGVVVNTSCLLVNTVRKKTVQHLFTNKLGVCH